MPSQPQPVLFLALVAGAFALFLYRWIALQASLRGRIRLRLGPLSLREPMEAIWARQARRELTLLTLERADPQTFAASLVLAGGWFDQIGPWGARADLTQSNLEGLLNLLRAADGGQGELVPVHMDGTYTRTHADIGRNDTHLDGILALTFDVPKGKYGQVRVHSLLNAAETRALLRMAEAAVYDAARALRGEPPLKH